jgi:low affinity Fe/Cu permease
VLVISAAGGWVAVSAAAGFPARWEIIFQTLVAALTLVMVFVIQHTQARHQRATQRKLDEILLAMPEADNSLLTLEHASDEELRHAGHQHRQARQAALGDRTAPGAGRLAEGAGARLSPWPRDEARQAPAPETRTQSHAHSFRLTHPVTLPRIG